MSWDALAAPETVSRDHLALFHRTLAELCRSEVPLPRAFRMLGPEISGGPLREAVQALAAEVESGAPLAEAYARRAGDFPPLYRALVAAGTAAGDLPGVLEEIARHASQRARLASRLRAALAYPLVAAAFVVAIGSGLLWFVAPRLWEVADSLEVGSRLPFALGATALLALVAVFGFLALRMRGPHGSRVPLLGRLRRDASRATVAATLALLLRRRVPLPDALALAAESADDEALATDLRALVEVARNGARLGEALRERAIFDPDAAWLVDAGEHNGDAARALEDVAAIHRDRFERGVDRFATLLTPMAELVVGAAVFIFAYSYVVPLYDWAASIFRP